MSGPESEIQAAILEAFWRIGVRAWRTQAGKVKVRGAWMQLGPPGLPDITVIVPPNGRFLGLEVKAAKGKLRPAQVAWAEGCKRDGSAIATVRSVDDALWAYTQARAWSENGKRT